MTATLAKSGENRNLVVPFSMVRCAKSARYGKRHPNHICSCLFAIEGEVLTARLILERSDSAIPQRLALYGRQIALWVGDESCRSESSSSCPFRQPRPVPPRVATFD